MAVASRATVKLTLRWVPTKDGEGSGWPWAKLTGVGWVKRLGVAETAGDRRLAWAKLWGTKETRAEGGGRAVRRKVEAR